MSKLRQGKTEACQGTQLSGVEPEFRVLELLKRVIPRSSRVYFQVISENWSGGRVHFLSLPPGTQNWRPTCVHFSPGWARPTRPFGLSLLLEGATDFGCCPVACLCREAGQGHRCWFGPSARASSSFSEEALGLWLQIITITSIIWRGWVRAQLPPRSYKCVVPVIVPCTSLRLQREWLSELSFIHDKERSVGHRIYVLQIQCTVSHFLNIFLCKSPTVHLLPVSKQVELHFQHLIFTLGVHF